ncbi:leukotriene B4 receptor 1-like [Hypomesus transpacificus]|uniref:leukotriene B4 receptor 1-like n=1 Tax=Hypomesus transpacificus TaxID=137520 RepID=UPI001F0856DA|nr:leukotriene B4 receptor 1-like [Hypomesus transpacificus]
MQQHNNSRAAAVPVANQVSSAVLGLCFLFGMPGNIMVVVVILRNFKKDHFTLRLILNLAVSDILCLLPLPAFMHALLNGWTLGTALCKVLSFLIYTSLYNGLLTVTLMSVQRYLVVLYPHHWAKLGRRGERVLLFSLWVLASVLSSAAVVTNSVFEEGGKLKCWRISMSDRRRAAVVLCETLLGFVVPFSILVTSYCYLHKKVNQTSFFSSQRLTRLVTLIVVTFFVLWIPVHILNLMDIFAIFIRSAKPAIYEQLSGLRAIFMLVAIT